MVVSMAMDLVIMDGTYDLDRSLGACINMNRVEWSIPTASVRGYLEEEAETDELKWPKKVECSATDLQQYL